MRLLGEQQHGSTAIAGRGGRSYGRTTRGAVAGGLHMSRSLLSAIPTGQAWAHVPWGAGEQAA
jgi:hypothetical protein